MNPAVLVLEDGTTFEGTGFGANRDCFGEVVFNTGMTGYQEVLTDPSYDGQIVTMTYPHIGNYGVNEEDLESSIPRVSGFVVRDVPPVWSSWRGRLSLDEYLVASEIPAISEIDTRKLTRLIRNKGAMRGAISSQILDAGEVLGMVRAQPQMAGLNLVGNVSATKPFEWPCDEPRYKVAAYDFGIKYNILRLLAAHKCATTVYPASTPADELISSGVDGVFLSNGPGDPEAVRSGIDNVKKLIGRVPVFGVCLGHQLMGLAAGFGTYKLRFGHRGINHPVARLSDGAIEITTQNHGFAVSAEPFGLEVPDGPLGGGAILPDALETESSFGRVALTHVNLNDYTVEGFRFLTEPAFCVQYHPEAGPGPHDSRYLFEEFTSLMESEGA